MQCLNGFQLYSRWVPQIMFFSKFPLSSMKAHQLFRWKYSAIFSLVTQQQFRPLNAPKVAVISIMPLSKCNYLIHSIKPYENHYVLLLVRQTIGSKAYNQGPPMSQLMCRISDKVSARWTRIETQEKVLKLIWPTYPLTIPIHHVTLHKV